MNKRRQPFGYQICGGRVAVKCSEADIVKYIFRAYIGGASFNDIKFFAKTMFGSVGTTSFYAMV